MARQLFPGQANYLDIDVALGAYPPQLKCMDTIYI